MRKRSPVPFQVFIAYVIDRSSNLLPTKLSFLQCCCVASKHLQSDLQGLKTVPKRHRLDQVQMILILAEISPTDL